MRRIFVIAGVLVTLLDCRRGKPLPGTPISLALRAFEDDDEEEDDAAADEDSKHYTNQKTDKGFVDPKAPPPPIARKAIKNATSDDLPDLAKQQRAVLDAPTKPADSGCGEIQVGKHKVELDCYDDDYAKIDNAAKPAVKFADIGDDDASLPASVDHREDGSEGPVRDQGKTLSCTAFSLATALDHDIAELTGKAGQLSPMHLWSRYHTPNMKAAERANEGKPITDMTIFPFDEATANKWEKGLNLDAQKVSSFDSKSSVKIASITDIDPKEIKQTLASGQDVWFALRGAHNLQKPTGKAGFKYIADYDWKTSKKNMGHAIVLAGYRTVSNATYYLVHNSWGDDWGDDGYAYVHETTLMRNISSAYSVDAVLADENKQRAPIPTHRQHTCKAELVPDSVTGQCTPKCTDGSPRHNGVCPDSKACPKGQVNVEGECVRAAASGTFTSNGFVVTCAPGGCVYKYPSGKAGCTKAKGCETSCPSPKFRLAISSHGAFCTE